MENKIINQVLAELEDSLANLETARNQVNNVSNKSEDLVFEFSNILKQLEIIEKEKLFNGSEFKKKVDDSYLKFNKKIELTNKDFTNRYEVVSDQFKSEVYSILEKLQILGNDLDKLNNTIVKTEQNALTFDFKSVLKNLIFEINSKIEKFEENQYRHNKSLIFEVDKGFKNTLDKIHEIDPNNSYKKLNSSISDNTMKVIKMEVEIDKRLNNIIKDIHEIDPRVCIRDLNKSVLENSNSINKIESKILDGIEALKVEFESKLNNSIGRFKRTIILINIAGLVVILVILFGIALKWLRYI